MSPRRTKGDGKTTTIRRKDRPRFSKRPENLGLFTLSGRLCQGKVEDRSGATRAVVTGRVVEGHGASTDVLRLRRA